MTDARTRSSRPGSSSPLRRTTALSLLASSLAVSGAAAQCPHWLPGAGIPGVDGEIRAMALWDPDGPGPRTPVLAIGGIFTVAGDAAARNIAAYDPNSNQWSALGSGFASGLNNSVNAIAPLPNGDLLVGGTGGTPGGRIARWDGSAWHSIGDITGPSGSTEIDALLPLPDGSVMVGGRFTTAGGVAALNVARWDGASWTAVGAGLPGSSPGASGVYALVRLPSGDIVAGGNRLNAANAGVARWDGAAWTILPGITGTAKALLLSTNGDLVVGGNVSIAGDPSVSLVSWNGVAWSAIGGGASPEVRAIATDTSGDLVVAGTFTTVGPSGNELTVSKIARWDGAQWRNIGGGVDGLAINALALLPTGELIAGGDFAGMGGPNSVLTPAGVTASSLARWDGESWSASAPGTSNPVFVLASLPGGGVAAGGTFTTFVDQPARHVAAGAPGAWSALDQGVNHYVRGLVAGSGPDAQLYASGSFSIAGELPARGVARWNGQNWSPLGVGLAFSFRGVEELSLLPNGDLLAGGTFSAAGGQPAQNVARWDGTSWHPMHTGLPFTVQELLPLDDGVILAGGESGSTGLPTMAHWDGDEWKFVAALSTGRAFHRISAMVRLPNGDVVVAGDFNHAGDIDVSNIARWDGETWHAVGDGLNNDVYDLLVLPSGDLIAAGGFTQAGTVAASHIARWDGQTWSPLGGGTNDDIYALALSGSRIVAAGAFTLADGRVSAYLATWASSPECPADFNCDDVSTSADFFAFLTAWFDFELAADVDNSGVIDSSDFFHFLAAFFNGC